MIYAVVIAGGVGKRTQQEIPKQFINVYDKPILLYTLEGFQIHPEIDAICTVCLEGWHDILAAYSRQFGITKLKWIISGGETCQESIRNGVNHVYANRSGAADDIAVIHDGIRPLVDKAVLSDCIAVCREYGNAVTSMPYNEQIFKTTDGLTTTEYIPRETLRRVQTPQAYHLEQLYHAYNKAFEQKIGIYGSSYTNTMMAELGETLHFAAGSEWNIKITTARDIELFKAILSISGGGTYVQHSSVISG